MYMYAETRGSQCLYLPCIFESGSLIASGTYFLPSLAVSGILLSLPLRVPSLELYTATSDFLLGI